LTDYKIRMNTHCWTENRKCSFQSCAPVAKRP